MNKQEAEKYLSSVKPVYGIIGIKNDGSRGIPPNYSIQMLFVPQENIFDGLKGFEQVRVFTLAEEGEGDDWLRKRNAYFAAKTVEDEKKLYEELKLKFEKGGQGN